MVMTSEPPEGTEAGRVTVTLCRSRLTLASIWLLPKLSGTERKFAVAPPTVTLLTDALAVMRKVKEAPVPRPTLTALRIATVLIVRSAGCRLAVMSKLVSCHAALASSWAGLVDDKSKRVVRIAQMIFIG